MRFAECASDRFQGYNWTLGCIGVPLLSGVLATFECKLERVIPAGDHKILIGRVVHLSSNDGDALVLFRRQYRVVAAPEARGDLVGGFAAVGEGAK